MSNSNEPDNVDCQGTLHPKAIEGILLFNSRRYFEAHEPLEAAWRDEIGPVRDLYQGILQAGVVYLHITRHNYLGAIKVHQRCQKLLRRWPEICRGVAIGQLKKDLEAAIQALQELGPLQIAEFNWDLIKPVHYSKSEMK
jgi:predicted metal-dependent hydrolase